MNPTLNNTSNYLVPSSGGTHSVSFNETFSAIPSQIDWRQFAIDNYPFIPQGVFIDNSAGISPLVINFQPLNYNVTCPAGGIGQYQFPSVDGQTTSITGNGQASVIFVDFPVLPSVIATSGGLPAVQIAGPNPLPVSASGTFPVTQPAGTYQGVFSNSQKTVTNASTQLLAANANRRYLLIQNNDAAGIIYVTFDGSVATLLNGIKILPGGSVEIATYLPNAAINAIGSIATQSNVVIVEG